MSNDHNVSASVIDAISRGRKIEAIKLLREQTGLGLKEAKERVEQYSDSGHIDTHPNSPLTPGNANLQFDPSVIAALNQGRKIEAIKLLRQSRRIGLKEAKELVDEYCRKNNVQTQAATERNLSSYAAAALAIGLIVYLGYKFF